MEAGIHNQSSDVLKHKKVLVTGASGFLGKRLCTWLERNSAIVYPSSSRLCDLRNREETLSYVMELKPDVVFHCAVQGGGIGWMKDHPVESGMDNYRININILEASYLSGAKSFVGISSACVYPKQGVLPYCETEVWGGYPEPFNGPYALSKRAMMDVGRAFASQYGFHCVFPILGNLYGPGDHISSERAHVIADLMQRAYTQKSKQDWKLSVWGTGIAEREFLYVDDAVEGVLATLLGNPGDFFNIGTGISTPIRELAASIAGIVDQRLHVVFDGSKPDGQLLKVMDVSKIERVCGWKAKVSLEEGLRETWAWYAREMEK